MLLKMKTTMAGPEYTAQAGELFECADDNFARQLIKDGNAEEYQGEPVAMISTFHGGLKAANVHLTGVETVDPPADVSTAREQAQVEIAPAAIERRTADELAEQARRAAAGPVSTKDPLPPKSSDQRAAEEMQAKVSGAQASATDPKASAHERLASPRRAGSVKPGKPNPPEASAAPLVPAPEKKP